MFEANQKFYQQTNKNIEDIQRNINSQFQNPGFFPCVPNYGNNNGNFGFENGNNVNHGNNLGNNVNPGSNNVNNVNPGNNNGNNVNTGNNNVNNVNPGKNNGNYVPPFPGAKQEPTTENIDVIIGDIFTTPPTVTTNKDGLIYNIDVRLNEKSS